MNILKNNKGSNKAARSTPYVIADAYCLLKKFVQNNQAS